MNYAIFTDTSANLPTPMLRHHDIFCLPFHYMLGGEDMTCVDTEAFDGHAYYDAMRGGAVVTTSQINPQTFIDGFEPELAAGRDVLYVGMSSGISGAFQSAQLAMAQLKEQWPERELRMVDTLGASLGEGLLVLRAAEYREAGVGLSECARRLLTLRHRMRQVFTVDDLMFLRRTGRVSGAAALVGSVLHIKPLLKGDESGRIMPFGKVRGRKRAIESLARQYAMQADDAGRQTVGIAHADCAEDAAHLAELLQKSHPPRDILTVMYEPVTGAHVGPGALALFFLGGDGKRDA